MPRDPHLAGASRRWLTDPQILAVGFGIAAFLHLVSEKPGNFPADSVKNGGSVVP
jgi:hypothetical protein